MQDETRFHEELAKVAPEGHSRYDRDGDGVERVWCPWAYDGVRISVNHVGWPICSGCLRPVDLAKAGKDAAEAATIEHELSTMLDGGELPEIGINLEGFDAGEKVGTFDITPTLPALRRILNGFEYAIESHQRDLVAIEKLGDSWPESYGTAEEQELIAQGLGLLYSQKVESIAKLRETILDSRPSLPEYASSATTLQDAEETVARRQREVEELNRQQTAASNSLMRAEHVLLQLRRQQVAS